MGRGRFEFARKQFPRQPKKRVGVLIKEIKVKNGFRVGQIVLAQVVVEAGTGGTKVRDASGHGDASTGENDDLIDVAGEDFGGHVGQRGWGTVVVAKALPMVFKGGVIAHRFVLGVAHGGGGGGGGGGRGDGRTGWCRQAREGSGGRTSQEAAEWGYRGGEGEGRRSRLRSNGEVPTSEGSKWASGWWPPGGRRQLLEDDHPEPQNFSH